MSGGPTHWLGKSPYKESGKLSKMNIFPARDIPSMVVVRMTPVSAGCRVHLMEEVGAEMGRQPVHGS